VRVPLRYWYKVVQASLGALGLSGIFLAYRRIRRKMQHGRMQVAFGEQGAVVTRTSSATRAGGESA
jgi:hypothetical protein